MNYLRHLNGFYERLAADRRLTSYHISLYLALFQQWNANRFSDQFTISRSEMMELARIGSANTYARCMRELAHWGYIIYLPTSNLHLGSKVTCTRFDGTGDATGNTGIRNDTATDTAGNTASDTGTSGDLKTDSGADTAGDTGFNGSTGSDTGRSTATRENDPAGIKSDTGTDTASDTLFLNRNKLKEEESSKRNSKEKVSENPAEDKAGEKKKTGDVAAPADRIPGYETVRLFFEQNHSSAREAGKFYTHYQSSGWKTGDKKPIVSWQAVACKWIENNLNQTGHEREYDQIRTGKLSVAVNKNYNEPL